MGNEEHQLIDRCLAGEQAAMAEFVERFRTPVFGLAYRMLGHRHDAEDISQESFLRALRSLHHLDRSRAVLPWLLAIVGNRCRTLLASRKKHPTTRLIDDDVADTPIESDTKNLVEEVYVGLADLRVEYRQAFLLFHEQQLSYQEISEVMGKPIGTIKTWVHRGRRELVERLRARGVVEAS